MTKLTWPSFGRGGRGPQELSAILVATLTLLKGALIARFISMASIPILSRIYSPTDFGLLAAFTAVLTVAVPFTTLRYALAIPIVRSERAARGVVQLAALSLIATTIALTAICILTLSLHGTLGGLPPNPTVYALLVLGFLLSGSYELLSNWSLRLRRYGELAAVAAKQTFTTALVKIGAGLLFRTPEGLIFGHVSGQAVGLVTLAASLRGGKRRPRLSSSRLRDLGKQLWQFPAFRLPSQFLLALSAQMPVLFVAQHYNLEAAGHFGLAMTVLTVTVSVVATSIGQAFFGEIASVFRTNRSRMVAVTLGVQARLLVVGGAIALAFYFLAQPVVVFALGSRWALTGTILSSLSPYVFMQITCSPIVKVMDLLRRQYIFLMINLVRIAIVIATLIYTDINNFDVVGFSISYSISMAVFYILVCICVSVVLNRFLERSA